MRYEIMKLMCMFDLPVETEEEKKAYRIFRKKLIQEGFIMMQYSIYVRTCPNREYVQKMEKKIKGFVPKNGNVRLISVTEKQYDDMKILVGSKSLTEEKVGNERMIII